MSQGLEGPMFAICNKCKTQFDADGRLFGCIPLVGATNWQVELIGPEHERYEIKYGKMVECPKCGSRWKVFPHSNAGCSGCLGVLFLLIFFPLISIAFFLPAVKGEMKVWELWEVFLGPIGWIWLGTLIAGLLVVTFGVGPHWKKGRDHPGGFPDDLGGD
jgi:hypothetical protein